MKKINKTIILTIFTALIAFSFTLNLQKEEKMQKENPIIGLKKGNIAPDFTINNEQKMPITLSKMRGKVVLIDFWASWCRPCRDENPNVVLAYNEFKDKGFEIIGVSVDENEQKWLKAIETDKLTWAQGCELTGWEKSEIAKNYNVKSIPMNFLLDKDGVIIAKNLRGSALEKAIKKALKPKK